MCFFRGFLLVTVFLGLLAGCASGPPVTTDYDASEGVTTYETKSIPVMNLQTGSALGHRVQVSVRALSRCTGTECEPDEVMLVFQASGSNNLRMENPSIELEAGYLDIDARSDDDKLAQRIYDVDQVTGTLASIVLSLEEFRQVAEADEVSGSVGSSQFHLDYDDRRAFRALTERTKTSTG